MRSSFKRHLSRWGLERDLLCRRIGVLVCDGVFQREFDLSSNSEVGGLQRRHAFVAVGLSVEFLMKIHVYDPKRKVILETVMEGGQASQPVVIASGIRSDEDGKILSAALQLLDTAEYSVKLMDWAVNNFNEAVMPAELVPIARYLMLTKKAVESTKS